MHTHVRMHAVMGMLYPLPHLFFFCQRWRSGDAGWVVGFHIFSDFHLENPLMHSQVLQATEANSDRCKENRMHRMNWRRLGDTGLGNRHSGGKPYSQKGSNSWCCKIKPELGKETTAASMWSVSMGCRILSLDLLLALDTFAVPGRGWCPRDCWWHREDSGYH